jgi:hypothetical protein
MEIIVNVIGVILSVDIVGDTVIGVLGLIAALVGNVVGLFAYIIILCIIATVFNFFTPVEKKVAMNDVNKNIVNFIGSR